MRKFSTNSTKIEDNGSEQSTTQVHYGQEII